jgi:hypothetical protein
MTAPNTNHALAFEPQRTLRERGETVEATAEDLGILIAWRENVRQQAMLRADEARLKALAVGSMVARDATRMTSPIGAISVTAKRKTGWATVAKVVCEKRSSLIARIDAALAELGEDMLHALVDRAHLEQLNHIRGELEAAASFDFDDLVTAHTRFGEPSFTRPRAWTADVGEPDEE